MQIEIKKLKKRQIKDVISLFNKIGADALNFDIKNKEEAGGKLIKVILEKYNEVDEQLTVLIASMTNLTSEQIDDLDFDEFADLLKKIWSKNNFLGFMKSGK